MAVTHHNYRPITLLCCAGKLGETTIISQLMAHIKRHKLMPASQHAYQKKKSTGTIWCDLDTEVQWALDRNWYSSFAMVDMQSAFNLIDKSVLLPKLRMMGVGEHTLKLIESYLTGRTNRTKIGDAISSLIDVLTGCGEGSCSGPSYYNCATIDSVVALVRVRDRVGEELGVTAALSDDYVDEDVRLSEGTFADDKTGIVSARSLDVLEAVLKIMFEEYLKYFSANALKVNVSKSEHIIFYRGERVRKVFIDGREEASSVKLLGLTVDNKYSFDKHSRLTISRMNHRLTKLKPLVSLTGPGTMTNVAESLVMSIPRYNCDIWLNNKNIQSRVQKTANMAMRCVTNKPNDYPVREMLKSCGWLNMKNLHEYTKLTRCYSIFHHEAADVSYKLWRKVEIRDRAYRTRVRQWKIAWTARKRGTEASSFILSAVSLCNLLGLNSRIFTNKTQLKHYCKTKLIEKNGNDNI